MFHRAGPDRQRRFFPPLREAAPVAVSSASAGGHRVDHSTDSPDFGGPIVWRPTPQHIDNSNLKHFMDRHRIGSYDELMRRSTDDFAWFWDDVLRNELRIV